MMRSNEISPPSVPAIHATTRNAVILLLASGLCFFFRLGAAPLTEPDEGRNAEVAREMTVSGDWCTPHLNFERKLNKPVLLFWASALSMRLGGVNEAAARFPSALAAAAGVFAVYFLGQRMYGARAGLLAGLVLASSPMYIAFGRIVIFDMMLTAFVSASLLFFYLALTESAPSRKRAFSLLMYSAMALAVLTKGPVGAVIPLAVMFAYLFLTRRLQRIRELEPVRGILLFLIIAAPWYVLVSIRNPEFPGYFFLTEHIDRFATDAFSRVKPFWYYLPVVFAGAFPWTLLLPSAFRDIFESSRRDGPGERPLLFLVLWVLVIFLLFTVSRSKQPGYVLPLFPALAVTIGAFIEKSFRENRARVPVVFFAVAALLFAAGLWAFTVYSPLRSSKLFASRLQEERRPGDMVVSYETFPSSLIFYLGERVPVITNGSIVANGNFPERDGGEQQTEASVMKHEEFKELLGDSRKRIYIVGKNHLSRELAGLAGEKNRETRLLLESRKRSLWVLPETAK